MESDDLEVYIYNTFIDYSKGIGKSLDENEDIYIDKLNNFDYKKLNSNIDIDTTINIKDEFFKKIACKYYCKKNNKKIKDFIEYIDNLELKKEKKFSKSNILKIKNQEKLYDLYLKYLKELVSEKDLLKEYRLLKLNKDIKTTNNLINYLENESYKYCKEILNNTDKLDYLNNYGPLKTRLKKEGKISKYSNEEIKYMKELYENYINYYNMNISYDEYLLKENKLLNKINNNRKSYIYRKKAIDLINYYMKDIINSKFNINKSNLYKKCYLILEDYYNNNINYNIEELISTYRLNIYNYGYLYAKENDLLDEFNSFKEKKNNNIRNINYKDIVNDFIKIRIYNIDDYLKEFNIDKKEFKRYINYIKNNDNNLYIRYQAAIIKNKNNIDKYNNNRINGLYLLINNGIPSNKLKINREFKLLDYYIYCDKFLYEYNKVKNISKRIIKGNNKKYYDIIEYIKEIEVIKEEELLQEKFIYQGLDISLEDKKNIINYLNKYNIPLSRNVFIDAIDRYMNNNLYDLCEELLSIKELSYKKIDFTSYNNFDIEII